MANYMGGVKGARGEATRLGSRGLTAWAKSWLTKTYIEYYTENKITYIRIVAETIATGGRVVLYCGPEKEIMRHKTLFTLLEP